MNEYEYLLYKNSIIERDTFQSFKNHLHHGDISKFDHLIAVSDYSYKIAKKLKLKLDYLSLIRGALLHDYFFYDWHDKENRVKFHAFRHPKIALKNASKDFNLTKKEKDIIRNHMFPLTLFHFPKSKESLIVSFADKWVAYKEYLNHLKKKNSKNNKHSKSKNLN